MTAASGVLHKEFHEKEWAKSGGEFQMVQLWVNLPAANKMDKPKYQAIQQQQMAKVDLGANGHIELIAGNYQNQQGPATTHTPMHMMNAKLKKEGRATFEFPADFTTLLLAIEGSIVVNGEKNVPENHLVLFNNDGAQFEIKASEDAVVLVLSGKPIGEPIFAHGPFVMNNRDEIIQAFEDFNNGKFGYLED
jgi:redox-sensitive bicupin YhaK (pirin superfamily)